MRSRALTSATAVSRLAPDCLSAIARGAENQARSSPISTRSPTFFLSQIQVPASISSSLRSRPAPSAIAAMPTASASIDCTIPALGVVTRTVSSANQPRVVSGSSPPCSFTHALKRSSAVPSFSDAAIFSRPS